MAHPLIIFGAGASFDFLQIGNHDNQHILNRWRPPLTNNLFDSTRFSDIIKGHPNLPKLASTITNIVQSGDPFDFEAYLSEEEAKYPDQAIPQIMALRFYLAELLGQVSYHFYRDINNHNHLLDQVTKRVGKAIIVNFNYDTLLERNISELSSAHKVDDYIKGPIKVIKIHGAHNWRYNPEIEASSKQHPYDFFQSNWGKLSATYKDRPIFPDVTNDVDYSRQGFDPNIFRDHIDTSFTGGAFRYFLPAIGIPIASKANYICPETHMTVLKEELALVDRILIIGWRAQDEYLVKLLKDKLKKQVKMVIVSRDEHSAQEIALNFKEVEQIDKSALVCSSRDGYSDFMIHKGYEDFLI